MADNQRPKNLNPDYLDTGGGAFIGGDATAETVVGRDKVDGDIIHGDKVVYLAPSRESTEESTETSTEPTPGEPPYLGLHFFTEKESHLFFGRDTLTAELLQQLSRLNRGDRHFLAIIGASGSGKSSLARAGLVPALHQGKIDGSNRWPIHIVTPTARPLEALALALTRQSESVSAADTLMEDMQQKPNSLHLYISRMLAGSGTHNRLVLIVDQFEETFTLCRDEETRRIYIDNLLYAAGVSQDGVTNPPTLVILTMRADFYAHCAQYSDLRAALEQDQKYIGAMEPHELRDAIELPAQENGWAFETGLVDQILRDLGNEPGHLPLLSHALRETWERRVGNRLTAQAYSEMGGLQGAIAHRAESIYGSFDPERQAITRRIMLRLTQPGQETEDTRRRSTLAELAGDTQANEVVAVIQALADARLLTTARLTDEDSQAQEVVDVAHEALIRGWPRLQDWVNQDRTGLLIHRRLTEAANEWQVQNQDSDMLYRGARLIEVEGWASQHLNELNDLERTFLNASREWLEQEEIEKETQHQRLQRLVNLLGTVLILAMITTLGAIYFYADANQAKDAVQAAANNLAIEVKTRVVAQENAEAQTQRAEDQTEIAEAETLRAEAAVSDAQYQTAIAQIRQWSAQSDAAWWGNRPIESLLLATYALKTSLALSPRKRISSAEESLRIGAQNMGGMPLVGHKSGVGVLAFSPDGKWLATGSVDRTARLWNMDQPNAEPRVLRGHERWILTLAFSPDGKWLATGSADNTARLWNMDQPDAESRVLRGHYNTIRALAFSPDGKWLATRSSDNTARLWDVDQPDIEPRVLHSHESGLLALAFSPDGKWLATGSGDNMARLWDMDQLDVEPQVLRSHKNRILSLAFSPDGKWLATGSWDNTVRLWDVEQPDAESRVLRGHEGWVDALAFSLDGKWLATGSAYKVQVWSVDQPDIEPRVLRGHENGSLSLVFSPDGKWLATGSSDHTARLWNVVQPGAEPRVLRGHDSSILALSFSPDGKWLATGSDDNTARLWDVEQPDAEPQVLRGHNRDVQALAFSPDGKWLATGSDDNAARLWDVEQPDTESQFLHGHDGGVQVLTFSPDGKWLATGSDDNTARLWDVDQPDAEPQFLRGHDGDVLALSFSPGGKWLTTGSADAMVRLWDMDQLDTEPRILRGHEGWVRTLAFSPDGKWLATGSHDTTARLWDVEQPDAEPQVLRGHIYLVRVLSFSPDGKWLATGSYDHTARLWDVDQPDTEPQVLYGHGSSVLALSFSPDGKWLATGGADHKILLWDVAHPNAKPHVLRSHGSSILALSFSPDGKWLATGGGDNTARLWDVSHPDAEPHFLHGHDGYISALSFSPDGEWLATGSTDSTARLWRLQPQELIALACRLTHRNFSWAEWDRYFRNQPYELVCLDRPVPADVLTATMESEDEQTSSLEWGLPMTGATTSRSFWHFTGTAGQVVTLSLGDTEDSSFDPYLILMNARGRTIAYDDNSGGGLDGRDALIQEVILPEDGVYFVWAGQSEYAPGSVGVYELQLTEQEAFAARQEGEEVDDE